MPFEFPFNLIGILLNKGFSEQAIHETYSNPGSQVGAQNKDFGAVSQLDLSSALKFTACSDNKQIFVPQKA